MSGLLDKLKPETFHCASYCAVTMTVGVAAFCVVPLSTIRYGYEKDNFHCKTVEENQKTKEIEQRCYEEYNLQHDRECFPLVAFLFALNILPVVLVSFWYSSYVRPRVVDSTDNGQKSYVCKVFTAYIAQLVFRLIMLIVVLSVTWSFYTVKFPTQFTCPALQTDHSPGLENRTAGRNATLAPMQSYNCENKVAGLKSGFWIPVCVVNLIGLVFTFSETMYLLWKTFKDSTFCKDEKFCPDYLSSTKQNKTKQNNQTTPQDQEDQELTGT